MTSPGGGQPAPIAQTLALINDVYAYLSATDEALQQKTAPPPSDAPAKLRTQAARLPEPIRTALLDLGSQGAAQTQQARRANLSGDLKESISAFCDRAVNGRYPFNPTSTRDVLPEDFGALFAPGGKFDDFFQKNLARRRRCFRETVGLQEIGFVGDANEPGRTRAVRARRDHPRRVLRGGRQDARAHAQFKPLDMDPTILSFTLDVDGQVLIRARPADRDDHPVARHARLGRVSLQLTPPPSSGASNLMFEGPWALFRMFDRLD